MISAVSQNIEKITYSLPYGVIQHNSFLILDYFILVSTGALDTLVEDME